MRTIKALACAAVLAAGIATSMAQTSNVYSLNVVGYYNVPLVAGQYQMVANQLNTTNNSLDALLPAPADGLQFLKYDNGWTAWVYSGDDGTWEVGPTPLPTLAPGDGAMLKSGIATTLTFVGEVVQGNGLTVTIPKDNAYHVRSSIVPQAGYIQNDLGYSPDDGDQVLKYSNGWVASVWSNDDGTWDVSPQAVFGVGEAIMFKVAPGTTGSWVRNFTVQ